MSEHRLVGTDGPQHTLATEPSARRTRIKILALVSLTLVVLAGAATGVANAAGGRTKAPSAPAADPNPNCSIVVPANPLSARGLATPYQLFATSRRAGACHEANPDQSAFVQATIIDVTTGAVSVYSPLVVDAGTTAKIAPVVPRLPKHAMVGIWFGYNGDNLTLTGAGSRSWSAQCVNGLGRSLFTQYAYCNAPAFFAAANVAIAAGRLTVPARQTANDGQPCPTVRDFAVVDQDQSDNVTSTYLTISRGRTAQNTAANRARLGTGATVLTNGSDNGLLDSYIDPALGCTPFTAPDLADPGVSVTSLALNELDAAATQPNPVALVPTNDPMTLVGGARSVAKTNLYRVGVDQPMLRPHADNGKAYCQSLFTTGMNRIATDRARFVRGRSPDPADANLFVFLADRLSGSFDELGCGDLLGIGNPVTLQTDGDTVVDATFVTTP
jgi:hypothetical protein